MAEQIERVAVIPAAPEAIFDAWVDAAGHAAMTGSPATSEPVPGGRFTAWGGYIQGTWESLERPGRIVMAWSTSEFPDGAPPSRVEVVLAPIDGGTEVAIRHSGIPDGQGASYHQGWLGHYLEPMATHFG